MNAPAAETIMPLTNNMAVVLAGAVANGAFEAGALEVLAERGYPITRILGTSSGALNATLFSRYTLAGDQRAGAAALVTLWRTDATWWRVFRPSLTGIVTLTGFSTQEGLLSILRKNVQPVPVAAADVELCVVVTALRGRKGDIGGKPATTHEGVCSFSKKDIASTEGLRTVFEAAAASASFPGAFAPAKVAALGRCADGGIVNNTPLKHVIAADVGRVVVIVPSPRVSHERAPDTIGALAGRVADIVVQERLYRDLRAAEKVNARLAALDNLATKLKVSVDELKSAAGLAGMRHVDVVEIRPSEAPPNSFAGFFCSSTREKLIQQGRAAARAALAPKEVATAA